MNNKKTVVIALSMAVFGAAAPSSARADEWNKCDVCLLNVLSCFVSVFLR